MSGEAVVVTAPIAVVAVAGSLALAGAAIVGTAAVGAFAVKGVARGIAAVIDMQIEAARQRAAEERARLAEWESFQHRQQQAMEEARQRHEAIARMQRQLSAVRLQAPATPPARPAAAKAVGYVAKPDPAETDRELLLRALAGIAEALDSLAPTLDTHPGSPLPQLRQQIELYRRRFGTNQPPDRDQIENLRVTAERSTEAFLARLEAERGERESRIARADTALNLLLVLGQLPGARGPEWQDARRRLMAALESGDIAAGALEEIERRLKAQTDQAAEQVAQGALRPALAESLMRHLRDLGYQVLAGFPEALGADDADAKVRVPGGGQVAIQLGTDGKLLFRFAHERTTGESEPLDAGESALARQQEGRWCKDLRAIVARLVAEGFESRVSFDRKWPAIPVVVHVPLTDETPDLVESPSEWKDAAEEEERRRRRILDAQKPKQRSL